MAVNPDMGNPMIVSMQKTLNDKYHAGLREDGWCGPQLKQVVADLFKQQLGMTYTFRKGDQTNLVYLLQAALYLSGYTLNQNGIFDAATEDAVRAFQRDHGLVESGTVTPDMLRVLFPAPAVQPPRPQPVPAPTPRAAQPAMQAASGMVQPMSASMPVPPATTRPAPGIPPSVIRPTPAPSRPTPLPAPMPNRPTPIQPLPAPVPNRPGPNRPPPPPPRPQPEEYTIRLSSRNPEAIIKVRYDR